MRADDRARLDRETAGRDPLASVIILTKNAGPGFDAVLRGVGGQRADFPFETIVIDSGSTDDTVATARRHDARIERIEPAEFHHAVTRNLGGCLARGEHLVFLTQDAEPDGDGWLSSLVHAVAEDPRVAGAYSRVLPPRDADPLTEVSVLSDINARAERIVQERGEPGEYEALDPYRKRLLCNFNDVSSCIRRSVWRLLPFPLVAFGEDLFWAKAAIEAGHRIVFESSSVVRHGHEYRLKGLWRRAYVDGVCNRTALDRRPVGSSQDAVRGAVATFRRDARAIAGRAPAAMRLRALAYRMVEMAGLWAGGRKGVYARASTPSPDRPLRVLLALHAFPPDSFAGTEVCSLTLARELRRRGHEVAVFHRVEDRNAPNYSLSEGEFDGFTTFRIVNNLEYGGIEETVQNAAVEEKFRWVLARLRPDVVHFQHCLHTSASLITAAKRAGIPVALTLHDYWFICPKVQLIRTDGTICTYGRPGLRCVRCADNRSWKVRVAKRVALAASPVMPFALRMYAALARRFPRLERRILLDANALSLRPKTISSHLASADVLLSPSRFLKERYVRFGIDPGRIFVSRNGIRTEALATVRRREARDRLRLAFIGSFVWYKGAKVAVAAVRLSSDERVSLVLHGDDRTTAKFRAVKSELLAIAAGDPRIRFAGPFRNDDLPALYEDIDVLVVPSVWFENAPLVIMEAFAAGVPVVASRLGALPDFVHDGRNGLLFAPGDPEDLARVIRRLLEDSSLLDRLRGGVSRPKDASLHAAEVETFYRQILGQRDGSREAGGEIAPCAEVRAHRFDGHSGTVHIQGGEFALLRPHDGTWSSVRYRLNVPRNGRYRVALETRLLDGETGIELGGEVLIDEKALARIGRHSFGDGTSGGLVRVFEFDVALSGGSHWLEVRNRTDESRRTHLRLRRVLLFALTRPDET